jgi:hypothetical protein
MMRADPRPAATKIAVRPSQPGAPSPITSAVRTGGAAMFPICRPVWYAPWYCPCAQSGARSKMTANVALDSHSSPRTCTTAAAITSVATSHDG